jgi:hypothetical protein
MIKPQWGGFQNLVCGKGCDRKASLALLWERIYIGHIVLSYTLTDYYSETTICGKSRLVCEQVPVAELGFKLRGKVSIYMSQMDIKRKTCDIRTWTKHLFLEISSTKFDTLVLSFYYCLETTHKHTHASTRTHTHTHTHTLVSTVTSSLFVAWWQLRTAVIPLPLGSRTITGLRYHFSQQQLTTTVPQQSSNSLHSTDYFHSIECPAYNISARTA